MVRGLLVPRRCLPMLPVALPKNDRLVTSISLAPLQRQACRQHHHTGPGTTATAPGPQPCMTGDAAGSGPGGWAVIVGSAVSLDLTAVCAAVPEPDQIARMVGPLMSMVLRRRVGGHALIEYEGELHWKLLWEGTSTFLSAWPPGLHEWGGSCWDIELTIGERYDQSLLQMYVTGAAIALLGDGFLVDERNFDHRR